MHPSDHPPQLACALMWPNSGGNGDLVSLANAAPQPPVQAGALCCLPTCCPAGSGPASRRTPARPQTRRRLVLMSAARVGPAGAGPRQQGLKRDRGAVADFEAAAVVLIHGARLPSVSLSMRA